MKISIIYNDPTQYATGTIYDDGVTDIDEVEGPIDMSEYGVLDELESVQRALLPSGHETKIVAVALDVFNLIDELRNDRPDMIFNLCESFDGDPTQEMNVASLFELLKIPYTGSRALTLGLALNKWRVKEILNYYDIPTAPHYVCKNSNEFDQNGYSKVKDKFPLIVKPSREDASIGIENKSVVYNDDELKSRIEYILDEYKQPALIEQFIDGREINVSVVGNIIKDENDLIVFPVSEIDFSDMPSDYEKIVSYNSKWMYKTVEFSGTKAVCPAKDLSPELEQVIRDTAKKVYRIIGASDYARVDFRVKDNIPYVLEMNPNPDISSDVDEDTGFTRSGKAYGWSYEELILNIVKFASVRWGV
ncbi:MAG TPA: ATP-grasp domain-containing protein [Ignavibacteria bacterium]|nr:ATP-grasp domain-containing protein [Ignavibacteria bacterium]HMR40398.1 ATP-grasp domain-containing protein [Ignavibacteria bacterium]